MNEIKQLEEAIKLLPNNLINLQLDLSSNIICDKIDDLNLLKEKIK